MPDMSGFDVLDKLKAEPAARAIPVIVMTSLVLLESDRQRLAGKAYAILSKGDLDQAHNRERIRSTLKEIGFQDKAN